MLKTLKRNGVITLGRINDTTNHVNTTMLFKSKLTKNFSNDNYWIESLQNKVDKTWFFATDVVDIQEEIDTYNNKGYRVAKPSYKDIEVRITSAYDETGNKLSNDYKNIIFKDIQHDQLLGRKYLFNVDDFASDDPTAKCTWLDFNFDTVKINSNSIIRRCNCQLGMLVQNNTTEWYEPAVLDYNPQYTISYFNDVLNTPKSETYVYVQFNEYTKSIKMSDRFILGALDFDDKSNNAAYKVKEVFKVGAKYTSNPNSIPMLVLALERDVVNLEQDLISRDDDGTMHYIADYYLKQNKDNNKDDNTDNDNVDDNINYYLKLSPNQTIIYEGKSVAYECYVYDNNDNRVDCSVQFNTSLSGTSIPESYFESVVYDNSVVITNLRRYFKNDLVLTCSVNSNVYDVEPLSFSIQLGEKL